MDDVASRVGDDAQIVKVNIDALPQLAKTFGITSIPTVIYLQAAQEQARATGIETADAIVVRLRSLAPTSI